MVSAGSNSRVDSRTSAMASGPDIQGRLAKALLIPLAIADVRESTLELDPALTM
jgi:hypothetical protein